MSTQDWTPVVFRKHGKSSRTSNTELVSRTSAGNPTRSAGSKLDKEEHAVLGNVSAEVRIAIQRARQAKNMSQKDLASALNEKPSLISDYERGKAVPNNALVSRMERILECKLPRQKRMKRATE